MEKRERMIQLSPKIKPQEKVLPKESLKQAPIKAKKKKKAEESVKPLTPEEKAELAKTEKEVAVAKQSFTCLVHRGPIYGNKIYLCRHCSTFYCERCAKVLKVKGEKCWTCDNEIEVEVSEQERRELLEKKTTDFIDELIQEKAFISQFLESDKNFDDFPQFKDQLFSVLSSEEIHNLDLLKLPVEEKKKFMMEYLTLNEEERKNYLKQFLEQQ